VTGAPHVLVLAETPVGDELADRIGRPECLTLADPYNALRAMGRRRWPSVVLTAPRPEFAGLCRAARRLQRDGRLFAVCSPAGELDVRPLLARPLDDYFVYPLTDGELSALRRAAALPPGIVLPAGPGDSANSGPAPAAPPARQIAELIDAAHTVESLEAHLAESVASLLAAPVRWVGIEAVPPDIEPLLLAAGAAPRVLVPSHPVEQAGPEAEAYLAAVRHCLPALLGAARRIESLHHLAVTDHLTRAYNRRYFYSRTDDILRQAGRDGSRVTLLLYDIDDFKRYNDTYGHAAGDEILRDTATLMRQITRSHDLVARIGGDEFAVLFCDGAQPRSPGSRPPETAFALADRFRRAVQEHDFTSLGPEARGTLTISGGLAAYPVGGRSVRDLLRTADAALREAKASGKNAIHLIGGD
jgi:diguanylate cyclase (GGDEF)-like protein